MMISLDNLSRGIKWWRCRKWPADLHNNDYNSIYQVRARGLTRDWWRATVTRLSQWRAFRGRQRPNTREEISESGELVLTAFRNIYRQLTLISDGEPSIVGLSWEDIGKMFDLAFGIKHSPVFAGKMCHFIFPKLFIVMDNTATGVMDYEFCWRGMKDEWHRFRHKAEAKSLLIAEINKAGQAAVHAHYPFVTKIMEISMIGNRHQ